MTLMSMLARSQNSVSDQPITYSSNALITPGVSGGASGGISNSQLMVPHMRNLLLLEMEEHAILQEMHELASSPLIIQQQIRVYGV